MATLTITAEPGSVAALRIKLVHPPAGSTGLGLSNEERTITPDGSGVIEAEVLPLASYKIKYGIGQWRYVTIPDQENVEIQSLIG